MTATTSQSRKAKGRELQKYTVKRVLEHFPMLTENDVYSTSMGCSGADLFFSEAASVLLPYYFECKNQERVNIWSAWDQAVNGTQKLKVPLDPVVVVKRNRRKPLALVDLETFLYLASEAKLNG